MPSRDLTYNLLGKDVSASSTFGKTADAGESMTSRIGAGISSLGGKIGGELGSIISEAGDQLEQLGEHGLSANAKLGIMGAGVAALGVALGALGSTDKAAQQQLDAAITATGASYSDYGDQIEEAISQGENFDHSAADTQNALAILTEKTGDVTVSLSDMLLVENLAAAKHETLTAAATQLGTAINGNTKLFKQYGIEVAAGTLTTAELTDYVNQLENKMSGQAAAASDTYTGKLDAMRLKAIDLAARFGGDVAPALTLFGTTMTIASGVIDIFSVRAERATASELKLAAANLEEGTSAAAATAGNTAEAASADALATSAGNAAKAQEGTAVAGKGLAGTLGLAVPLIGAVVSGLYLQQQGAVQATTATKQHGAAMGALVASSNMLDGGLTEGTIKLVNYTGGMKDAVSGTGTLKGNLDQLDGTLNMATVSTLKVGDAIDLTSTDFKTGATYAQNYTAAINQLSQGAVTVAETQDKFTDGLTALTTAAQTNGRQINDNTADGRANREAILDQITAINDMASKQLAAGATTQQVNATLAGNEAALRKAALAAGFNSTQVDAMIKQYEAVPTQITTKVFIDDEAALDQISSVAGQLSYLAGLESTDKTTYDQLIGGFNQFTLSQIKGGDATGGIIGMASGGIKSLNGVPVNEFGGELFDMGTGRVYPTGQSQQMKRGVGGGGVTHNYSLNIGNLIAGPGWERTIADGIAKLQRQNHGPSGVTIYGG